MTLFFCKTFVLVKFCLRFLRTGWGCTSRPWHRIFPWANLPSGVEPQAMSLEGIHIHSNSLRLNCNASSPSFGAVVATNRCTKEWFPLAMGFTTFLHWAADFILAKSEGTMPVCTGLVLVNSQCVNRCACEGQCAALLVCVCQSKRAGFFVCQVFLLKVWWRHRTGSIHIIFPLTLQSLAKVMAADLHADSAGCTA